MTLEDINGVQEIKINAFSDARGKFLRVFDIEWMIQDFFIKQTISSNYTKVKFKVESFDEVAKSSKLCVA